MRAGSGRRRAMEFSNRRSIVLSLALIIRSYTRTGVRNEPENSRSLANIPAPISKIMVSAGRENISSRMGK